MYEGSFVMFVFYPSLRDPGSTLRSRHSINSEILVNIFGVVCRTWINMSLNFAICMCKLHARSII
jgi:hypothetical protein